MKEFVGHLHLIHRARVPPARHRAGGPRTEGYRTDWERPKVWATPRWPSRHSEAAWQRSSLAPTTPPTLLAAPVGRKTSSRQA